MQRATEADDRDDEAAAVATERARVRARDAQPQSAGKVPQRSSSSRREGETERETQQKKETTGWMKNYRWMYAWEIYIDGCKFMWMDRGVGGGETIMECK